jgi:hypothetical protein
MLGVDFGKLRQRLGLLERRLEAWQRGEPTSVSDTLTPVRHAAESALERPSGPSHPNAREWSAAFQEFGRRLIEAGDRDPQTSALTELGVFLSHPTTEPADQRRLRAGVEALLEVVGLQTEIAVEDARRQTRRRASVDLVLASFQDVLANRRPSIEALETLADELLNESVAGPIELDFAPDESASRNLALQTLATAKLAAFLAAREPAGARTPRMLVAVLLMDAPLLDALGLPESAAEERRRTHGRDAAQLLAHLGLFDVTLLAAVERHHAPLTAPVKSKGGQESSPIQRLLAVAAAYVDNRWKSPDRAPGDPRQALRAVLLDAERGALDLDVALRLLEIGFFPLGTLVELATGEWAEVVATHRVGADLGVAALPVVRIRRTAGGDKPIRPEYRNLALLPGARIVRELEPSEARKLATDRSARHSFPSTAR